MRSWGWIPHDKNSVLKGRDQSPLPLYRVRTQQDVSLKTRKTVLIRQSICQCLDLGRPSLLNRERCLFKSSVALCYNSLNRLKQMFYNPSLLFFKLKLSQIWHLKPMFMPHQYSGIFFFSDSGCSKFTLSASNLESTVSPNIAGSVEQYLLNKIKVTRCVLLLGYGFQALSEHTARAGGGGKGEVGLGRERKSHTHSYKYLQFKTSNMVVFFIFLHLLSLFSLCE